MKKIISTLYILSILGYSSELSVMEDACKRGIAQACHNLGLLYNGSNGIKVNRKKQKEYLLKGCDLDSDKACIDLENIDIEKEMNNDT